MIKVDDELKKLFPKARVRGIVRIPLNQLHADLSYQKVPSKSRLNKMKKRAFSLVIMDALVVSFRNGKYNVVDGQHRLIYAKESGLTYLPCKVIDGLTDKDECALFRYLSDRRPVSLAEKLEADYESGEESVVKMVNILNNIGLIYDFVNSPLENRITAIKYTYDIFNEMNEEQFENLFFLIKNTWNGKSSSLQEIIIQGIYEFYKKYKNKFDQKTFIKQLGRCSCEDIIKEVGTGKKKNLRCASIIREKYNYRLREDNKLDDNNW